MPDTHYSVNRMNKLTLDLSDPDIADALKDCKVGEQESLTLKVTPTNIVPGKSIEFDVDEVEYSESPGEAETPSESTPSDTEPPTESSGTPAPKKKMAPAIAIVLGGK